MAATLQEVEYISISVLVNNEVDPITQSQNPDVKYRDRTGGVRLIPRAESEDGAKLQMRMDKICCGAHGLSLVITATTGEKKRTVLFDAGPEEKIFEMNASRMDLDAAAVDLVQLSHWHRDHSGGLPSAIKRITAAKKDKGQDTTLPIDLHPVRPDLRGIDFGGVKIAMEADPTFEDLAAAGGSVNKHDETHLVLDDMFAVSGEVPRVTDYEQGLRGGIRLETEKQEWEKDELIKDERFLMCNLKGKGLVVFAGCSHPGIVNICKHALEIGGGIPLYAVVGGFHVSDADSTKLERTVSDLKGLGVKVLMPGHCTGWRFNVRAEQELPGCVVPCFGGNSYVLTT